MLLAGCTAAFASVGCEDAETGDLGEPSGGSASGGDAGAGGDGDAGSGSGGGTVEGSGGAVISSGGATSSGGSLSSGGATGTGSTGAAGSGGSSPEGCGWTFMAGGVLEDRATDVLALEDGSVVVVGIAASADSELGAGKGAFALRLRQEGSLAWSKVYPGVLGPVRVAEGHGGKLVVVGTAIDATACAEHHGAQDAWVAELSKDDGSLLDKKCIGGDDDDTAAAVVARGSGATAHYLITGAVDSHDNGNVGPNHNEGVIEATDVLLGYWNLDDDTASGTCFGSDSIDKGTAILDDGLVFANANSGDAGDHGSESLGGVDFAALQVPSGVCSTAPCASATRFGGPSRDNVNTGAGSTLAGQTLSTTGSVGCPDATNVMASVWVGTYSNGSVSSHGCLHNGGILGVEDVAESSTGVALVGLANPATEGDFAEATVDGPLSGSAGYIALYDEDDFEAPRELVVVGNQTTFYGVTTRADGCVVAVGTRVDGTFGDVFVYTR